jgi:hypothetical protein
MMKEHGSIAESSPGEHPCALACSLMAEPIHDYS